MEISLRGQNVQASPIRKFKPYADAALAKAGVKIYHLNIGDPDIPTPKPILDAVRGFNDRILGYGPAQGFLELRRGDRGLFRAATASASMPTTSSSPVGGSEAILLAFAVRGRLRRRDHHPRAVLHQLQRLRLAGRPEDRPADAQGRGRLPASPGRGDRGQDHAPDPGHPPLLAQQPDRHGLLARRAQAGSSTSRSSTTSSSSATRSTRNSSTTA